MKTKLRVGDTVKVTTGTYKNKVGNILEIIHKPKNKCKAIVSGVSIVQKHKQPTADTQGEIVPMEDYIYVDKLIKVRSKK